MNIISKNGTIIIVPTGSEELSIEIGKENVLIIRSVSRVNTKKNFQE